MTPLPSSRVPLLLETTKNTKPACSAAKIRGRAAFCHGGASDWVFWRALQKQVVGNFDRSTFISIDRLRAKFRSIDFSGPPKFQAFPCEICHSSLIDLHKQKNTKTNQNIRK
jgi:hypothetical protein